MGNFTMVFAEAVQFSLGLWLYLRLCVASLLPALPPRALDFLDLGPFIRSQYSPTHGKLTRATQTPLLYSCTFRNVESLSATYVSVVTTQ